MLSFLERPVIACTRYTMPAIISPQKSTIQNHPNPLPHPHSPPCIMVPLPFSPARTPRLPRIFIECRGDHRLPRLRRRYIEFPSTFHGDVNAECVGLTFEHCLASLLHGCHSLHCRHIIAHVHLCVRHRLSGCISNFDRKGLISLDQRIAGSAQYESHISDGLLCLISLRATDHNCCYKSSDGTWI